MEFNYQLWLEKNLSLIFQLSLEKNLSLIFLHNVRPIHKV